MSQAIRSIAITCLTIAVIITTLGATAGSAVSEPADVDEMIAHIRTEPSKQVRWQRAYDLALRISKIVDQGHDETISNSTIDALAVLLEDENEDGDFYVAGALGLIGPRANRAVPTLEAAHEAACIEARSHTILFGPQYVHAIELALERITGSSPDCLGLKQLKP